MILKEIARSRSEIADSEQIPRRFLEGILLSLRNMGLMSSVRRKAGGYRMDQEPSEIRLAQEILSDRSPIRR